MSEMMGEQLPGTTFHFKDVLTWSTGKLTLAQALIDAALDDMRADIGEQKFSDLYEDDTVQPEVRLLGELIVVRLVREIK